MCECAVQGELEVAGNFFIIRFFSLIDQCPNCTISLGESHMDLALDAPSFIIREIHAMQILVL